MARKKVNLAWITNDTARRVTFKKRRKGLMKKVSELTTLCGVKACVVMYGAGEQQPDVWPSSPEAMRLVARFKGLPEMEQCKKMMNQEGFLHHNIAKLQEQLRKHERENRELEINLLMYECLTGRHWGGVRSVVAIEEATNLAWALDMKLKSVQEKMDSMETPHKDGAGGSQAPNFNATVQAQLHNPFPLHPPPPLVTASSSVPPNLLSVAKSPMQVAVIDGASIERHNYFVGYGEDNKSSNGSINNFVPNDLGTINIMFGSTFGSGDRLQQDQMLPPGFMDHQGMHVNPWFQDHLCSFRPNSYGSK